ncbi:MAG: anti-sigma factor [Pseudoxanthomonas sp.]
MNTISLPLEQDPPDGAVLAGEYVLGVLDAEERRSVERRIASEPSFASEVAVWENHLMALAAEIAPVPVPAYVWARISDALGFGPPPRSAVEPERSSFWNNIGLWRWLGVGGFATAAVCSLALLNAVRTPPPVVTPVAVVPALVEPPVVQPAPMVSTLAKEDGKPGFVATVDKQNGRMTIMPMEPITEDGRVQELWLIPADGTPRSLGIVSAEHAQSGQMPEQMLAMLDARAIFAITLEPPGGGPGGKPSGPITAKGALALL